MATKRKATDPTTEAIDQFSAQFDDLFSRRSARQALRQYLIGLLLPREHNKALTALASLAYWKDWSKVPPPAELAALLDHVAHSKPLVAPT